MPNNIGESINRKIVVATIRFADGQVTSLSMVVVSFYLFITTNDNHDVDGRIIYIDSSFSSRLWFLFLAHTAQRKRNGKGKLCYSESQTTS